MFKSNYSQRCLEHSYSVHKDVHKGYGSETQALRKKEEDISSIFLCVDTFELNHQLITGQSLDWDPESGSSTQRKKISTRNQLMKANWIPRRTVHWLFSYLIAMSLVHVMLIVTYSATKVMQVNYPLQYKSEVMIRLPTKRPSDHMVNRKSHLVSLSVQPRTFAFGDNFDEQAVLPSDDTRENKPVNAKLDFFVAGFPKCGTTSLLYAFDAHNETAFAPREYCEINAGAAKDNEVMDKLSKTLSQLHQSKKGTQRNTTLKTGIKCPTGIRSTTGISRISKAYPDAKIIIGVRHPVLFFQSFFNYRVTEMHDKKEKGIVVPSAETLIGTNDWRAVSTNFAQFEYYLMQLGKTALTSKQVKELGNRSRQVVPSNMKIFLYTIEQLEDADETSSMKFRNDMKLFLGLEQEIRPFPHDNVNHFVGKQKYPETMNICEAKYSKLRKILIEQGEKTQAWINNEFLRSDDVVVGGYDGHFASLIESWGSDPCDN